MSATELPTTLQWLDRKLILIMGKGGVGKTTMAEATAKYLASQGKRVYLAHVLQASDQEDSEEHKLVQVQPGLFEQTLSSEQSFREYISLKLKVKALYSLFMKNKLMQYFQKAAPGVREIVMLGKVWYECNNYDHVVVDMPSTGYGLTMLRAPYNFSRLFPGGPIYHDSLQMLETLGNPKTTAIVTVTLAEEMPMQESFDMADTLKTFLPNNRPWLVVNRLVEVETGLKKLWSKKHDTTAAKKDPLLLALEYRVEKEKQQAEKLQRFLDENQNVFSQTHRFPEDALPVESIKKNMHEAIA